MLTLQETNISPKNGILKMIFLFPRWDMLIPWRVSTKKLVKHTFHHGFHWVTTICHVKKSSKLNCNFCWVKNALRAKVERSSLSMLFLPEKSATKWFNISKTTGTQTTHLHHLQLVDSFNNKIAGSQLLFELLINKIRNIFLKFQSCFNKIQHDNMFFVPADSSRNRLMVTSNSLWRGHVFTIPKRSQRNIQQKYRKICGLGPHVLYPTKNIAKTPKRRVTSLRIVLRQVI